MKDAVLILAFLGDPKIPPGLPNSGGFNQTLDNLTKGINHENFDIIIITDSNGLEKRLLHEVAENNIEIYRIETTQSELNNQNTLYQNADRLIMESEKIIKACKRNIKLIHTFYWISGYIGKILAEQFDIPFIHTVISLFIYRKNAGCPIKSDIQFRCEKEFINSAKYVLAITEDEKRLLIEYYGVDEKNIYVTGRHVDTAYLMPSHNKNNIPMTLESKKYLASPPETATYSEWWKQQAFLYVGRMVPVKGVDIIIRAWIKLYHRFHGNVPALWLVGGSLDEINAIRRLCGGLEKYEKDGKLIWWGYLTASSISTLLLKSCALLVHSNYEPGGRVILEAFSQGVPVISTPCGFGKDYIVDGYNGHIVQYGNVEELLRCMAYYANNPFLSDVLGNNAKRYFLRVSKNWNYYQFHFNLYRHYVHNDIPLPKQIEKLLPDDLNDGTVFERLTQFPYPDLTADMDIILQELSRETETRLAKHSLIKQTNAHYVVNDDGKEFHLHIVYNTLSPDSTWNRFVSAKGNSALRRIKRMKVSTNYASILKPLYLSENNLFIFSQYDMPTEISVPECLLLLTKLSQSEYKNTANSSKRTFRGVASAFQKRNNFAALPPFSLQTFFEILQYHIKLYKIDILSAEELSILYSLICSTEKDNPKGINYGSPIRENTCFSSECLYLLPTDTWYYGELGADIITLFLEIDKRYLFEHKESILGISHVRLALWQCVILLHRLFVDTWNRITPNEDLLGLLHETLDYVFNMK